MYPSLTWRVPTEGKTLYLTFDDGPVPGPTEFVVSVLRQFNAQATFFCIGDNMRKHPDILSSVVEAGHRIGNHTFNHVNGWRTPADAYAENVERCRQELVTRFSDMNSRLFRPPYGRITRKQIRALSAYRIVMWDVLTMDYNPRLNADRCLRRAINASRNGSILVFHDSLKAEKNMMHVLPRLLDHFASRGFVFKAIPE